MGGMFNKLPLVLATLWFWQALAAAPASPDFQDLVPVPRDVWDQSLMRTADNGASVGLADHEKFVWASSDKPGEKAVVVSMVAYSKQDEKILDMDKFSFALDAASCNAEDFFLHFKHPLIYQAAKIAWNWVNYNDLRSFVIVPSWTGCGDDRSHDPWVVKKVEFDDKTHKVILDATESNWKKVMSTFVLDFGELVLGRNNKRDIIPDLDKKFTLDVGSSFPKEIFSWEVDTGVLNATLQANCDDCGTEGSLVFAGHVEASLGWTGIDIDKFELSVKPQGVKAHVGVSLEFQGEVDFRDFVQPSQELNLLDIPVSGWRIPKVFEFGPNIEINAGYVIDYIGGSAVFSTGITASIPDTAIAKLDLKAEDSVQVSGWTPEIETDPLELRAQIDAQTRLYTEIALSVSITILDDNGFGVDLALKVPQLTVTTSGGVDLNGFCEPGEDVFGVKIESTVGANLALEGWAEVDGDRNTLAQVTLVDAPDLYTFPQVCFAFGDLSEGYCLAERDAEDEESSTGSNNNNKRGAALPAPSKTEPDSITTTTEHHLKPRQSIDKNRSYQLACDEEGKYIINALKYYPPSSIRTNTNVPIIKPGVECADTKDCVPDTGITVITKNKQDRAVVRKDNNDDNEPRMWASEHVYEAVWIRDFLDHVQKNRTGSPAAPCHADVKNFFDETKAPDPTKVPKPTRAKNPKTYQESLMQNLGTIYTYRERMALLPMKQNNYKHRMFAQKELVGYFKQSEDKHGVPNDHFRRTCDVARIVTTCRYYENNDVRQKLNNTLVALEGVLKVMDEDPNTKPDNFSFVDAHREWYDEMFKEGIDFTRERLKNYAEFMDADGAAMKQLSTTAQEQVGWLADGSKLEEYCPGTPREDW